MGKASRGKKNPVIRKSEYVWTTVAYVIWPAGAKKLLESAKPMNQPFTSQLEQGMKEAGKKGVDVLYLGWSGHRDGNYKFHKASRGKKNPVIRKSEYVWTT